MKLSKWDLRYLRLALFLAIEWEEGCIEAHRCPSYYTNKWCAGSYPEIRKAKRRIKRWRKLLERLG